MSGAQELGAILVAVGFIGVFVKSGFNILMTLGLTALAAFLAVVICEIGGKT